MTDSAVRGERRRRGAGRERGGGGAGASWDVLHSVGEVATGYRGARVAAANGGKLQES